MNHPKSAKGKFVLWARKHTEKNAPKLFHTGFQYWKTLADAVKCAQDGEMVAIMYHATREAAEREAYFVISRLPFEYEGGIEQV